MTNSILEDALRRNSNIPDSHPDARQTCRASPLLNSAVVFFIGGAGDKESYYLSGPYNNIGEANDVFNRRVKDLLGTPKYLPVYLGYNEVRGEQKILRNVLKKIPSEYTRIYIVGHSLGGWNGAHLSSILASHGYTVNMLITLDPVGELPLVWMISNIHREKPTPQANFWINILANPSNPDGSDWIAEQGGRWQIKSGPALNYIADVNHYNAKVMFSLALKDGKSAADLMEDSIRKGGGI